MNRAQRSAAVEKLFVPGVVAFEFRGVASPGDLLPSEREGVAYAAEKRVREFAAGRLCARAALAALGHGPVPLPIGPDRVPAWPAGVVGSITHTDGYCVAVLGLATQFVSIGVDAERVGAMSPSLWRLILHPEEVANLGGLNEPARLQTTTIIFSAKEAFYKCQYPLTRHWVGFEEAVVRIASNTFELSIVEKTHPVRRVPGPWIGQFMLEEALVVAGIAVERLPVSHRTNSGTFSRSH